jgi:hypothetical protein
MMPLVPAPQSAIFTLTHYELFTDRRHRNNGVLVNYGARGIACREDIHTLCLTNRPFHEDAAMDLHQEFVRSLYEPPTSSASNDGESGIADSDATSSVPVFHPSDLVGKQHERDFACENKEGETIWKFCKVMAQEGSLRPTAKTLALISEGDLMAVAHYAYGNDQTTFLRQVNQAKLHSFRMACSTLNDGESSSDGPPVTVDALAAPDGESSIANPTVTSSARRGAVIAGPAGTRAEGSIDLRGSDLLASLPVLASLHALSNIGATAGAVHRPLGVQDFW